MARMNRDQLERGIADLEASIRAGNEWDRANGHKVYAYSGQARNDRATLRAWKRQLAEIDAPAVRFVPVTHGFRE